MLKILFYNTVPDGFKETNLSKFIHTELYEYYTEYCEIFEHL